MDLLGRFTDAMLAANAPLDPSEIARLLDAAVRQACTELKLETAEIYCGGQIVTMILTDKHAWEAVVIGPDAYQLYPGFFRDDGETVVWANVWIGENYSFQKFTDTLEHELAAASIGA